MKNTYALLFVLAAPVTILAQPMVYVVDQSGGAVNVVNAKTKSVVNYIPLYPYTTPGGIAISADGSKLYVTSDLAHSVVIVNPATSAVIKSIPTGTRPTAVVLTPNGAQAWITDNGSAQVTVVNTATESVAGTIPVGNMPSAVAFTPDGSLAFVTNTWDGTLSVINTATLKVQETVSTGPTSGACAVVVSLDGTQVYVGNCYNGTVTVHNTSGALKATITGFVYPGSLAMAPAMNRLLVTNGGGTTVSIVDVTTNKIVGNFAVGPNAMAIAVGPDGYSAYVTGWSQSLSALNTCSNLVMYSVPQVGFFPVGLAVH